MKPGTVIQYRLRLHGVPVRWRTRIETFDRIFHFRRRAVAEIFGR